MRPFRSYAACLCALFAFLLMPCLAQAQSEEVSPCKREAQTWRTLESIRTDLLAIRSLAIEVSKLLQDSEIWVRNQKRYKTYLSAIENASQFFEFDDIASHISIIDRCNVVDADLSAHLHGRHLLGGGGVTLNIIKPATTAKLRLQYRVQNPSSPLEKSGTFRINEIEVVVFSWDTAATLHNKFCDALARADLIINGGDENSFTIEQLTPGSRYGIRIEDPNHILDALISTVSRQTAGTDACAIATAPVCVPGDFNYVTETFTMTGGVRPEDSGLVLRDADGTRITLTYTGNTVHDSGGVLGYSYTYFPDLASLGDTAVAGSNLTMIDMMTTQGAWDAITITDDAITQVDQLQQLFLKNHPKFHPLQGGFRQ